MWNGARGIILLECSIFLGSKTRKGGGVWPKRPLDVALSGEKVNMSKALSIKTKSTSPKLLCLEMLLQSSFFRLKELNKVKFKKA